MSNKKTPAEMTDDELNKFFNDSIIEKHGLKEMSKQLDEDDVIKNFPKDGDDQEKTKYLDLAMEKGLIESYSPICKENEDDSKCQFSVKLFNTDLRTLL